MKTIEERAREFVERAADGQDVPDYINELLISCYCAAAEEEHALLTKWHDAKTDRPTIGRAVLLIMQCEDGGHIYTEYAVGDRLESDCYVLPVPYVGWEVVGWREIHE